MKFKTLFGNFCLTAEKLSSTHRSSDNICIEIKFGDKSFRSGKKLMLNTTEGPIYKSKTKHGTSSAPNKFFWHNFLERHDWSIATDDVKVLQYEKLTITVLVMSHPQEIYGVLVMPIYNVLVGPKNFEMPLKNLAGHQSGTLAFSCIFSPVCHFVVVPQEIKLENLSLPDGHVSIRYNVVNSLQHPYCEPVLLPTHALDGGHQALPKTYSVADQDNQVGWTGGRLVPLSFSGTIYAFLKASLTIHVVGRHGHTVSTVIIPLSNAVLQPDVPSLVTGNKAHPDFSYRVVFRLRGLPPVAQMEGGVQRGNLVVNARPLRPHWPLPPDCEFTTDGRAPSDPSIGLQEQHETELGDRSGTPPPPSPDDTNDGTTGPRPKPPKRTISKERPSVNPALDNALYIRDNGSLLPPSPVIHRSGERKRRPKSQINVLQLSADFLPEPGTALGWSQKRRSIGKDNDFTEFMKPLAATTQPLPLGQSNQFLGLDLTGPVASPYKPTPATTNPFAPNATPNTTTSTNPFALNPFDPVPAPSPALAPTPAPAPVARKLDFDFDPFAPKK